MGNTASSVFVCKPNPIHPQYKQNTKFNTSAVVLSSTVPLISVSMSPETTLLVMFKSPGSKETSSVSVATTI